MLVLLVLLVLMLILLILLILSSKPSSIAFVGHVSKCQYFCAAMPIFTNKNAVRIRIY